MRFKDILESISKKYPVTMIFNDNEIKSIINKIEKEGFKRSVDFKITKFLEDKYKLFIFTDELDKYTDKNF